MPSAKWQPFFRLNVLRPKQNTVNRLWMPMSCGRMPAAPGWPQYHVVTPTQTLNIICRPFVIELGYQFMSAGILCRLTMTQLERWTVLLEYRPSYCAVCGRHTVESWWLRFGSSQSGEFSMGRRRSSRCLGVHMARAHQIRSAGTYEDFGTRIRYIRQG